MGKLGGVRTLFRINARLFSIPFGCGLLILIASSAFTARAAAPDQRVAVLVELFTSEGCSTCPPADALLDKLDQLQPIPGAEVIAMSEHVDYWNHAGWKDPFSSAELTHRQQAYESRLGVPQPFTPQMIVDGTSTLVGSETMQARAAIENAASLPALRVSIVPSADGRSAAIRVNPATTSTGPDGDVYIAFAKDSASTDVRGGENRGSVLHYVSVVESLERAGSVTAKSGFSTEVPIESKAGDRLIVFVQEPGYGRVMGAAMYRISK